MADGFFARLGNLWRGFLSLWISGIEKEHPEIAYENAINSMIQKYSVLKKTTAAVIRRREDVSQRLNKAQKELTQVEADLNASLQSDQRDLGVVLIQKQSALHQEISEYEVELQQSNQDAESAKSSLLQVQSEIARLKGEKDRMLSKLQSAHARIKIQEQLEGLSVDAEVKALENVRDHIQISIAEAKLGDELRGSDLDVRLRKLRQSSGEITANDEWERLKLARAPKVNQLSE